MLYKEYVKDQETLQILQGFINNYLVVLIPKLEIVVPRYSVKTFEQQKFIEEIEIEKVEKF